MPFKPGVSGNPSGSIRAPKQVTELARAYSIEAIEGLVKIAKSPGEPASARVAAWNAPVQLTTNDDATFRRAIDLTDDDLAAIIAAGGGVPGATTAH